MKVYIITRTQGTSFEIVRVFSDKSMADKLVEIRRAMGEFAATGEWEVFEPVIPRSWDKPKTPMNNGQNEGD